MNLIGKMLDNRYEILEKIGIGGMATVYKAKDHILNRYDAVKILKDEFTTDSDFIKKFNSEAQSAASLTHPNIVSIYDVGNEDGLYYIVMELIQGKTLKEIINEDGILSWKWSVNIAIQIASALETAHKNNIIHRDIKPHNIIITEDGIAKVTDFGIAKAVSNSTITAFGTTIGSVHYFSPEHAKGGFTDAKSDLYSLGIVLYEMLTARVPFDADTPVSVALKQVQEEPIAPIQYNKNIPISVNEIILKAMQKDPNLRYQNATEMLEDLSRALKEPDENFVNIHKTRGDSPTQKIPTLYEMENTDRRTANQDDDDEDEEENKEKGKIARFFAKHKVLRVFAIIILAIVLFLVAMFGTLKIFSRPSQVQIPNLVTNENGEHLTEEEAKAILDEQGFKNYDVKYKNDEEVEEGYVISQDPEYQENFKVNITEEIVLTVSKGSENSALTKKMKETEITLPKKMVGKKKEDLEKEFKTILENLDDKELLDVEFWEIEEVFDEEVEAGIVVAVKDSDGEDVSGGEKMTLDKTLTVSVSKGSEHEDVTVPNVVNKSESDAVKTLEDLGLVVDVSYDENTNKTDGVVISQSVSSNKTVKEGSSISLTVNKLPTKSTVSIRVNVGGFISSKKSASSSSTDNTTEDTSSTTQTSVNVKINVGDETIYNSSTTTDVVKSYTSTGTKEVKVWIDDNLEHQETVNFASGNSSVIVE